MSNWKHSLQTRLFLLFMVVTIIPVFISNTLLYNQAKRGLEHLVDESMKKTTLTVQKLFDDKAQKALFLAQRYAMNTDLITSLQSQNREVMEKILIPQFERLQAEHDLSVLEIGDRNGVVFFRAHQPDQFGDDKLEESSVQAALNGNENGGFAFGKSGLTVRAFVPLRTGSEVIGTLQVGFDDTFLTDIGHSFNGTLAIYTDDRLAKTSDEAEKSMIGQAPTDSSIYPKIANGETVRIADAQGYTHLYYPLYDALKEHIIGMIRISQDTSSLLYLRQASFKLSILIMLLSLMIAVTIAIFLSKGISRPLEKLKSWMQQVTEGDLTAQLAIGNGKDEIHQVIHHAQVMVQHLGRLVREVHHTANELAASSEELSATIAENTESANQVTSAVQEIASGAETQLTSTEQSARAVEEMAKGLQNIAATSTQVSTIATATADRADKGNHVIQQSVQQMHSIQLSVDESGSLVQQLNERSIEIGQIVQVIDNIASQINLLALNAAIEAARAGEHGKGFGVVADEIRKLADQSEASAQQISTILTALQGEASQSVSTMEQVQMEVHKGMSQVTDAGQMFQQILQSIHTVVEYITEVSLTTRKISANAQQMSSFAVEMTNITREAASNTQQVASITERQVESLEDISASAESLSQTAQHLTELVERFKV